MRWLTVISTPSSARMSAAYDEASSAVDIVVELTLLSKIWVWMWCIEWVEVDRRAPRKVAGVVFALVNYLPKVTFNSQCEILVGER